MDGIPSPLHSFYKFLTLENLAPTIRRGRGRGRERARELNAAKSMNKTMGNGDREYDSDQDPYHEVRSEWQALGGLIQGP